jgi:hypothetical protein
MLQLTLYLRANAGISVSALKRDGTNNNTTDSTPNNVALARIMKTPMLEWDWESNPVVVPCD